MKISKELSVPIVFVGAALAVPAFCILAYRVDQGINSASNKNADQPRAGATAISEDPNFGAALTPELAAAILEEAAAAPAQENTATSVEHGSLSSWQTLAPVQRKSDGKIFKDVRFRNLSGGSVTIDFDRMLSAKTYRSWAEFFVLYDFIDSDSVPATEYAAPKPDLGTSHQNTQQPDSVIIVPDESKQLVAKILITRGSNVSSEVDKILPKLSQGEQYRFEVWRIVAGKWKKIEEVTTNSHQSLPSTVWEGDEIRIYGKQ